MRVASGDIVISAHGDPVIQGCVVSGQYPLEDIYVRKVRRAHVWPSSHCAGRYPGPRDLG